MNGRYERAKGDVSKVFQSPRDVIDADDLETGQKVELLKDWEQDLRRIIESAGEGMTKPRPGTESETLQSVQAALAEVAAGDGTAH